MILLGVLLILIAAIIAGYSQTKHGGWTATTKPAALAVAGLGAIVLVIGALASGPTAEEEATAAAEKDAACRADLECFGRVHATYAERRCRKAVEKQALYAVEWVGDDPVFSRLRRDGAALTYIGDNVRFQNGLGAMQHHIFFCTYDPDSRTVLNVTLEPGRL